MRWRRQVIVTVVSFAATAAFVVHAATPNRELVATVGQSAERVAGPPRRFTVVAGGDILTESRVRQVAAGYGAATGARFDFAPIFAPVRPILEAADVAICHMELPVGWPGGAYGNHGRSPFGGNRIVAPYEIATGARDAGFDRCSTASNHSYDVGDGGIASTLAALDAHGLGRTGTARSPDESKPSHFEIDGIHIAHISFTAGSNTVPPPEAWQLNLSRNPDTIATHTAQARRDGARIVLLSIHLTQELLTGPTPADRAFITAIIERARVDAVFIHGPHVVQPFEYVRNVPVWWSLGNFVSEMGGPTATGSYADPRTGDGVLASVRFTEFVDGSFRAEPETIAICNERDIRTVRPATRDLSTAGLSVALRAELQACLARIRSVVPDVK